MSFVEVLFYYHPAVWWIAGNIRLERENCCDDLAISACGNSLTYAKALMRLQSLKTYTPDFAMPFSGQKNQLLKRVKRILNQSQNKSNVMEKLAATCLLLVAILFMSVSYAQPESPEALLSDQQIEREVEGELLAELELSAEPDTLPEEEESVIAEALALEAERALLAEESASRIAEISDEYYEEIETALALHNEAVELRSSNIFLDSVPVKTRIHPRLRTMEKREQKITKTKNEDGETLILVETEGREPVKIVVNSSGDDELIIVDGKMLADGDTAIIIDEMQQPQRFRYFNSNGFVLMDSSIELIGKDGPIIWRDSLASRAGNPSRYYFQAQPKSNPRLRGKVEERVARIESLRKKYETETHEQTIRKLERQAKKEEQMRRKMELANAYQLQAVGQVRSNTMANKIAAELKKDGLIEDEQNFSFSITNKKMRVNGKKMDQTVFEKYRNLYKEFQEDSVGEKFKYEINISND